jgi:hypothetical protein
VELQEEQHLPQSLLQLPQYHLALPCAQVGGSLLSIHSNIGGELTVNLLNQQLTSEQLVQRFSLLQTL